MFKHYAVYVGKGKVEGLNNKPADKDIFHYTGKCVSKVLVCTIMQGISVSVCKFDIQEMLFNQGLDQNLHFQCQALVINYIFFFRINKAFGPDLVVGMLLHESLLLECCFSIPSIVL